MKRGKDDEKTIGPMFPRLHVNDREKGGPRAPPRNKMALYEQLSIPSQRFNHGMLPQNPNNTASGMLPASSSQESGHERGMFFQLHQPRSTQPAEKPFTGSSDYNNPLTQLELEKRQDDDDFTVPTFVQSETGKDHSKNSNGMDRELFSPSTPAYLSQSMNIHNTRDKEPRRSSITGFSFRQEGRCQNEENPKESMAFGEKSVKYVRGSPAKEKIEGPLKQTDASAGQEHKHNLANNSDRLCSTGASLNHESRARPHIQNSMCGNGVSNEPVMGKENVSYSILRKDSCPEKLGRSNGYHEDKSCGSLQMGNGDRSDDASETSMVDSISGVDICPDDVVGIIGQNHFWKARKAIVNQQRVFAVQLFELHRLIKVQRLIAGSPNVLIEDGAYLGKPLKVCSAKKVPLEYAVKPSPHIPEHKDDSENPNNKMECSAENIVGKTSVSLQNVSQPSNYGPFSGNPLSAPYFPQPPGHQWLIPIMSPSEGLIYKPYPGHGYGGCGPPGSNPVMGSFINHAYGVPAPHHHYPGMGFSSSAPPFAHGYFPLYPPAISPVNSGLAAEQANSFSGQGSHCQPVHLSGGVYFNMQQQSSCNVPTPKHGVIPNVVNVCGSNGSEVQGCTASSPGERAGVGPTTEGRNPLPLFPTSPVINVLDGASQINDTDQPTRVIKVVPHNARSATESVARIFQSIQEERKPYDLVSLN
ncbi:Protein EARLY FLOWERING like [Actinidia chinensis var. chinensis]|uniref:Protein EARLY FLOWERING like n=1 Tax=Actinidia chinensis var. chinensis TaxID=1590841 RepID=A0A2R6PIQ3_ACTCC|nr:Protein EARLY FLOWERING like [Actinidia chinensis var. chinensis]